MAWRTRRRSSRISPVWFEVFRNRVCGVDCACIYWTCRSGYDGDWTGWLQRGPEKSPSRNGSTESCHANAGDHGTDGTRRISVLHGAAFAGSQVVYESSSPRIITANALQGLRLRSLTSTLPRFACASHARLRHDHHRRGTVGAGGGDSAGLLRAAGLHPRAALHDRRAEFVLSPARPRLRRRPARGHQLTPKGTRSGPLAKLLRQLRMRWDDFALAPQLGSTIAFPGVRLRFQQRRRPPEERSRPRLSRSRRTTFSGCSGRSSTTTT